MAHHDMPNSKQQFSGNDGDGANQNQQTIEQVRCPATQATNNRWLSEQSSTFHSTTLYRPSHFNSSTSRFR